MKELKVKFKRLDNTVLMKVVQQDESTRNTDVLRKKELYIYNDIKLYSNQFPIFDKYSIHVKGYNKEYDEMVSCLKFDTTKQAKEYIKRANECIKAYNDSIKVKEDKTFPQMGDTYYHSFGTCEILDITFDDGKIDKYFKHINNFWETKEECKRYNEIKQKEMELSHKFTKEEWENDDVSKYHVVMNHRSNDKTLFTVKVRNHHYSTTAFKTEKDAQAFIDFCGYEDYCKFVLGVK